MTQKDMVIDAMKKNGNYATFQQLNELIDFSNWGTKTPYASVRRIVQTNDEFFKIHTGLWGLKFFEKEILKKFNIDLKNENSVNKFTHSYYQGIIVEIGNKKGLKTYVPAQDKNKLFLETKLSEKASVDKILNFSYPEIIRKAKTVDVIWFNERKMPCAFYEVEHTTDIKNSLNKFYELQDFKAKFCIVAAKERKEQFDDILNSSIYLPIKDMVKFVNYDSIINQYEMQYNLVEVI